MLITVLIPRHANSNTRQAKWFVGKNKYIKTILSINNLICVADAKTSFESLQKSGRSISLPRRHWQFWKNSLDIIWEAGTIEIDDIVWNIFKSLTQKSTKSIYLQLFVINSYYFLIFIYWICKLNWKINNNKQGNKSST